MSVFSEFKVFNNKTWSSHFLLWKKNKYYQKQSEVFFVWLAILWSNLLLLLICRHWMAAKIFCFLNQIIRNFLFNPFMRNIEKWPNFSSLSTKPTQWSNTLEVCRQIVWVWLIILWGWPLKGWKSCGVYNFINSKFYNFDIKRG